MIMWICIVVAVLISCVGALFIRRQWLVTHGVFTCELRLEVGDEKTPRWFSGVARYSGQNLFWYRFFSFNTHPSVMIPRRGTTLVNHTDTVASSGIVAMNGHRVARLQLMATDKKPERQIELGVSQDTLLGLMSWLEAEPPGIRYTDYS